MMDADALKERLRKMKALADFGSGGERDAAERLIRELCTKYGISLDDIEEEIERERTIEATLWKRKIFIQLLGLMRIEQYGDRKADKLNLYVRREWIKTRGRKYGRLRTVCYYTRCTDAQWLELQAKFTVLCAAYEKQIKAFPLAFLMRNDLLMPADPASPAPTAKEEAEYAIAENLSMGIEQTRLHKQLEMKD